MEPEKLPAANWVAKTHGAFWKLYTPHWKKLLYLSLMLLLPGGFWVLGLGLVTYTLNWGTMVHALQKKHFKNWIAQHAIHP